MRSGIDRVREVARPGEFGRVDPVRVGGVAASRALAIDEDSAVAPEVGEKNIVIVGDHEGGTIPHQFAEGLAELSVLFEVVLHPLRNFLPGLGKEGGAAVIVLVDLVAGEDDEIRIVGNHLGDRFLPGPGNVLVAGKTNGFQDRTVLRFCAEDAFPLRVATGDLKERARVPGPVIEHEERGASEWIDGPGVGEFPFFFGLFPKPEFHRLALAPGGRGRVGIQMHEQLHFAEVLAVLAPENLCPVGRGCE
ncbi:MAG: hypothetical protein P1U87_19160 [Verrucomicrobiales bacterium]|nr:hypothetical protein [Verrucomicrobiales bacterium]